jgi:hypothetical protein
MKHFVIFTMFNKIKVRAMKISFPENKRINPQKFKHSRATKLSYNVKDPILENAARWMFYFRMTNV